MVSGLASRDGLALNNFQIAGSNGTYYAADAVMDGSDILVSSTSVGSPSNVAFAYQNTALPNLMNKDSLTACPFKTETWNMAINIDPVILSTFEKSTINNNISIFPIPATDVLHIRFAEPTTEIRIVLVDFNGKALYKSNCEKKCKGGKYKLDGTSKRHLHPSH